jgi:hypothetical protein
MLLMLSKTARPAKSRKQPVRPKRPRLTGKPNGRPPTYTAEIGEAICVGIAAGATVTEAIHETLGPDTTVVRQTIYKWANRHAEFGDAFARACARRIDAFEEDILEIADRTEDDYRETQKGGMVPNKELVLRSKARIESRQWLMARRDPRLWGDKQSVDVSANIMLLSPEERVQKALQLFDLMEKFVERARNPQGGGPLVYDPGDDDLPLLEVPRNSGFGQK